MTKKPKKPSGKSRPTGAAVRKSAAKTKALASKPAAKRKPAATATLDSLDNFIEAAARALALPVEPQWHPAIKANLDVTLRLGALVAAFELPDEAEPAPVFGA
jgi:Protein of unknown function (DUF4089)